MIFRKEKKESVAKVILSVILVMQYPYDSLTLCTRKYRQTMDKILNLDSVDKFNRLYGVETLHPLVSVVNLNEATAGRALGSKLGLPISTVTELTRPSRRKTFTCLTPLPVSMLICSLRT